MAPSAPTSSASAGHARKLLNAVRWRIRLLVLLEGIALAIVVAVALFWLTLAMDYIPVKFGLEELSPLTRTILLVTSVAILLTMLLRVVGRRIFVSLKDSSMALLVERKFPQFAETLITAAESFSKPVTDHPDSDIALVNLSLEKANRIAQDIEPKSILNDAHVYRYFAIAAAGLVSLLAFAIVNPPSLNTAVSRLYLLNNERWQRESYLQWVALKAEYQAPVAGISEFDRPIAPIPTDDSNPSEPVQFKVGIGATLNLTLKARTSEMLTDVAKAPSFTSSPNTSPNSNEISRRRLPRTCKLYFRSANGDYGSQSLNKIGGPQGGWQMYRLQGSPLTAITSDLSFSILGGDFRLGPFQIVIVDQPLVTATKLDCVFPAYMRDENSQRGTDRSINWTGKTELPYGTQITINVLCDKPLQKVYVIDSDSRNPASSDDPSSEVRAYPLATITADGFQFQIPELIQPANLQFYLVDQDGIVSETPHVVSLSPIGDQPPEIEAMLSGIGSAITPNAVLPVAGTVQDDYDIQRVWLEIETPVTDTLTRDIRLKRDGRLNTQYDFQQTAIGEGGFLLPTSGAEISLVIKASDRFDLGDGPNVGISDQFTLSVVPPSQLLQMLEQLEVGQRKRLELIFNEVSDIREYLIRTRDASQKSSHQLQPGETPTSPIRQTNSKTDRALEGEKSADRTRRHELRKLFAQRSLIQIDKSAKEIIGVAESFDDIRLQLINNRVDSEDRKIRLAKKIVQPLRSIPSGVMADLRSVVNDLQQSLDRLNREESMTLQTAAIPNDDDKNADDLNDAIATADLTESAIRLTDQTLIRLDEVLSILVKYETQNELLDIVRRMISEQEQLLEQTKKLRQREAFDDLFQ